MKIQITEADFQYIVDSVKKQLNESFQSSKLSKLFKEHGGVKTIEGNKQIKMNNSTRGLELSKVTDEMMEHAELCAPDSPEFRTMIRKINDTFMPSAWGIIFNDGYLLAFRSSLMRGTGDGKTVWDDAISNKHFKRELGKGRYAEKDGKDEYKPENAKFRSEFNGHKRENDRFLKYGDHSEDWYREHHPEMFEDEYDDYDDWAENQY